MTGSNAAALDSLVDSLGSVLGLGDLRFATRGIAGLELGGDVEVTIERTAYGGSMVAHIRLAPLPLEPATRRRWLLTLLASNHPQSAEDGAATGLDPQRATAMLWRLIGPGEVAAVDELAQLLAGFARHARELRRRLGELEANPAEPADIDEIDPLRLMSLYVRA